LLSKWRAFSRAMIRPLDAGLLLGGCSAYRATQVAPHPIARTRGTRAPRSRNRDCEKGRWTEPTPKDWGAHGYASRYLCREKVAGLTVRRHGRRRWRREQSQSQPTARHQGTAQAELSVPHGTLCPGSGLNFGEGASSHELLHGI